MGHVFTWPAYPESILSRYQSYANVSSVGHTGISLVNSAHHSKMYLAQSLNLTAFKKIYKFREVIRPLYLRNFKEIGNQVANSWVSEIQEAPNNE